MQNPYVPPGEQGMVHQPVIAIPDHPLTPGGVVRLSGRFFFLFFPQVLLVTVVVYGPIDVLLQVMGLEVDFSNPSGTRTYFRMIQMFEFFIGILSTLALTSMVEQARFGTVSLGAAAKTALSRWAPALATNFRAGLTVLGLLILGIIPGLIWSLYYVYSSCIVSVRGRSGKDALLYSKSLVKGRWWRTLGYFVVFLFAGIGPAFVIGVIVQVGSETISKGPVVTAALEVVTSLIMDIGIAFSIVQGMVFFVNTEKSRPAEESDRPPQPAST